MAEHSPTLPRLVVRLADIAGRKDTDFTLEPTPEERAAIADELGIPKVRKLRFAGRLVPLGRRDWRLEGELGATVVQDCVVTLAPVTTRIDEPVLRTYVSEMPAPGAGEIEMPEDDSLEPLPAAVDLAEVMIEALSLALPPFPRAEGAELDETVHTRPGAEPLTDEKVKPFSGLASLKKSLENKDESGD